MSFVNDILPLIASYASVHTLLQLLRTCTNANVIVVTALPHIIYERVKIRDRSIDLLVFYRWLKDGYVLSEDLYNVYKETRSEKLKISQTDEIYPISERFAGEDAYDVFVFLVKTSQITNAHTDLLLYIMYEMYRLIYLQRVSASQNVLLRLQYFLGQMSQNKHSYMVALSQRMSNPSGFMESVQKNGIRITSDMHYYARFCIMARLVTGTVVGNSVDIKRTLDYNCFDERVEEYNLIIWHIIGATRCVTPESIFDRLVYIFPPPSKYGVCSKTGLHMFIKHVIENGQQDEVLANIVRKYPNIMDSGAFYCFYTVIQSLSIRASIAIQYMSYATNDNKDRKVFKHFDKDIDEFIAQRSANRQRIM